MSKQGKVPSPQAALLLLSHTGFLHPYILCLSSIITKACATTSLVSSGQIKRWTLNSFNRPPQPMAPFPHFESQTLRERSISYCKSTFPENSGEHGFPPPLPSGFVGQVISLCSSYNCLSVNYEQVNSSTAQSVHK